MEKQRLPKGRRTVMAALAATGIMTSLSAMAQQPVADTTMRTTRLETVVVSTSRASELDPLTTSNLNQRQISDNKMNISMPYLLNLQPSVVAEGENGMVGNTSMRVRGIDGTRINVNINGIPLNDAESQSVYWVNIPNLAGMAQNIQLQRGITAATGGSGAFGGAVNISSLNGRFEPYATADLSAGSFNTRQYGIMAGSGITRHGFSFDVAYNGLTTDGYVRNGFSDQQSLFLSATHYGKRSLLKGIVIIGKQHTGITWDGASAEELDADPTYNGSGSYYDDYGNVYYYGDESDNYLQRHYQLYYTYMLGRGWSLNAVGDITFGDGFYNQYKDDKKPGSKYGLATDDSCLSKSDFITKKYMDNVAYTASLSANYHSDRLQLSFGEMYQLYDGDHFGDISWAQDSRLYTLNHFSDSEAYEWYRNNGTKNDATTFARLNYNLSNSRNLYADLQMRYINYTLSGIDDDFTDLTYDQSYLFFNPKVGYNRIWNKGTGNHRTYIVAGISSREPTRADVKDVINPNNAADTIMPEHMLDIEAGYQYHAARLNLSANLYAMLYKDQLVNSGRISESGYALKENVGKSYRLGIELQAGWNAAEWVDIEGNLTLSTNKILDYEYHTNVLNDWWENTYDDAGNMIVQSIDYGTTDLSFSPSVVGAGIITLRPLAYCGPRGKDFRLQIIGKYVGSMYVDNTSREEMRQDAYGLLNLKASYTWHLRGGNELEAQLAVNNVLNHKYRVNAWNSTYYFEDGTTEVYRGYFQQPGTNYMGRVVVRF